MSQKNWDKYEVALLIEAYQNIKQGKADKMSALVALSQDLRQMAQNEGFEIDETFRNLNGMQWQLSIIDKAFLDEVCESRMPPRVFVEMVLLYKTNQQEFNSVLKQAHGIVEQEEPLRSSAQRIYASGQETIVDILSDRYPDFIEFCSQAGKVFPDDLVAADYVAFRIQYGAAREDISEIKTQLSAGILSLEKNDSMRSATAAFDKSEESTDKTTDCEREYNNDSDERRPLSDAGINPTCLSDEAYSRGDDPLYHVFNVNKPERFRGIPIEALGFNAQVNHILKGDVRKSIEDVLLNSIAEIFDLNKISQYSLHRILETIKQFVSKDFNSLEVKLQRTLVPLHELFSVEHPEKYKYVSINVFGFRIRFWNRLKQHKISNGYSLLLLTIDDMLQWDGLGKKSIVEAITTLNNFFAMEEGKRILLEKKFVLKADVLPRISNLIDAALSGEEVALSVLDGESEELFHSYMDAIEESGEEFFYVVKENPAFFSAFCATLEEFSDPIQKFVAAKEHAFDAFCNIPYKIREHELRFFTDAYHMQNRDTLYGFWASIQDACSISDVWPRVAMLDESTEYKMEDFAKFFEWLSKIDINSLLCNIFSNDALVKKNKVDEEIKNRYWLALEMRAEGKTLDEIGASLGMTKERIRQIEQRSARQIAATYKANDYDLLILIYALRGGDKVLRKEEVGAVIGVRYANLLWLLVSKGLLDCQLYKYSHKHDSVIFTPDIEEENKKLQEAFKELPDYFLDIQLNDLISEVAATYQINSELIQIEIETNYRQYGRFYSRVGLTIVFMCGYVLKKFFPHGFKIGVEEESQRFKSYLIDLFGSKGNMTYRALDNKITEVGVLCDRGKYIHPDYVKIDKCIIDEVNKFIAESPKRVLTYSEIFDSLCELFAGTQITNRFILQGILKLYGCNYTTARDYITKDIGISLTDEFEAFARARGEFHKTDFYTAFPALTDGNLGMLVGRCRDVFATDNGLYMHASRLNITEEDYVDIKKYLDDVCADVPVSSRFIYDEFGYRFIGFLTNNEINGHGKLFGILSYMFGDEYNFSRPYISKKEHRGATQKDIIMMRLEGYDTISIDEVVNTCEENGIRFGSIPSLIKCLMPEYVRIDESMLMRFELTGITDDSMHDIARFVQQETEMNRYVCSSRFDNFILLPQLGVGWNSFLLESVMDLVPESIHCIKIPMQAYTALTSIFVGEEFAEDDYQSFILKLLGEAYDKSYFTTKKEVRDWLSERGLISNNNLPKFLENSDYYYMDESGILRKRGEDNV